MGGRVVMTLVTLALIVAAAYGTVHLKHIGERGVRAERDLQGVATELQLQDALEWRAIGGRESLLKVGNELGESRRRVAGLVRQAVKEGLPASAQEHLIAAHLQYTQAVDGELTLLSQGLIGQAETFDDSDVDPAFSAVQAVLAGYADEMADTAARAETISDVGILLSVTLAMLLVGALRSRRRLAEARQEQVLHSEVRYRTLIDQSADIVMVIDRQGTPMFLSPAAERFFPRPPDGELTGRDLARSVHPEDRKSLLATLGSLDDVGGGTRVEIRVAADPQEHGWRHFEVSIQDLYADPAVAGIVLTGHDVTDRRALQREVEHRALHDSLTGLPNRALLQDRLAQALRTAQREGTVAGLLLIDLDRFKEINDTLGHHYGDQLLAQVGPRLVESLRRMDTVARLGGDEFAVLLPVVQDVESATAVAHKLQVALSRPFHVQGVQLDVEASIGLVISGAHGNDASTLIQRADIAMYVAKKRNLGVSTYDRQIDSNTPQRLALLGDLRRALQDDELFLHFQPKVDLRTGLLCGAEALLRWQHPERGLIPPVDFIPLAENTGLIGALTHRVLDLALTQTRVWADTGHPLQVAVNLSARNLLDEALDTTVSDLLARHGVGAELLKLEVTESAIMTDPTRATELLQRLAAQGLMISIDDFGAGYTSIRQLKELPISELKVDQSFVTDMESDPSNAVIVRSVIELGHNLGLSIVAEGVESRAGLNQLAGYGCDVVQGYFISRPMSADAFEVWRANDDSLPERVPVPARSASLPAQRGVPSGVTHSESGR
jgi:diguanylate cyclase (GGDEF)-like protein/PAS domain S-box-containing protein